MKLTSLCFSVLGGAALGRAGVVQRAACNADDCARSVTGTAPLQPLTSRRADCSSFQLATVIPATVTSTVTVTPSPVPVTAFQTVPKIIVLPATSTVTVFADEGSYPERPDAGYYKRVATAAAITTSPTAVPSYAVGPCAGNVSSRYASVCACWGITKSTTTLTPSTTSTTVTAGAPTYTVTVTRLGGLSFTVAPATTITVAPESTVTF